MRRDISEPEFFRGFYLKAVIVRLIVFTAN